MWCRRFPPGCEKCAALSQRLGVQRPGRSGFEHTAGFPPHDELEKLAEAGHIEWGIWLYRCRSCASWWEFDAWTYFPERSRLRRVQPVAALEKWTSKQRRAMQPRSLLVAGSLVFSAGLIVIAMFAGIAWLAKTLFSFDVAVWTVYFVLMACLLFTYRMTGAHDGRPRPGGL
jgi:hypothetical protein